MVFQKFQDKFSTNKVTGLSLVPSGVELIKLMLKIISNHLQHFLDTLK